jgi:S-formylglutathione hydrolase FrmB
MVAIVFYVDSPAEKMQTAIMQDLLPHLKQQFALLSQADAYAVGGVSMGGYGALRLVLAEPQQFRIVAALSPAVWQQVPEAAQSRMPALFNSWPMGSGPLGCRSTCQHADGRPTCWFESLFGVRTS